MELLEEIADLKEKLETITALVGAEFGSDGSITFNMPKYHAAHRCEWHQDTNWKEDEEWRECDGCLQERIDERQEQITRLSEANARLADQAEGGSQLREVTAERDRLKVELTKTQQWNIELAAERDEMEKRGDIDDGPCYYCGEKTNSLAGSPAEWAIPLVHADEPGRVKPHHIGCVLERLGQLDDIRAELARYRAVLAEDQAGRVAHIIAERESVPYASKLETGRLILADIRRVAEGKTI